MSAITKVAVVIRGSGIDVAHKEFMAILTSLKPSERVIKLFMHLVFTEWDKTIEQAKNEAKIRDDQIDKLEARLTTIAESNAKNILTDEEAVKRAEEIRKEIAVLKIERSEIRIEQYNSETVKNFIENFLVHLDSLWKHMDLPQKQVLQSEIFPQGLMVEEKKIRIVSLASTFELINAMNDENFQLVNITALEWNTLVGYLTRVYNTLKQFVTLPTPQPAYAQVIR